MILFMSEQASQTTLKPADGIVLAAVYELPASLAFDGTCLGMSAPVQIAGLEGEVRLPTAKWHSNGDPYVTAPLLGDLPATVGQFLFDKGNDPDDPWFWGIVGSWRKEPKEVRGVHVATLLFRFSTVNSQGIKYSDYANGRDLHPLTGQNLE